MDSLRKQQAFLQMEPNIDEMDPRYNAWFNFNSKDSHNIESGACYEQLLSEATPMLQNITENVSAFFYSYK